MTTCTTLLLPMLFALSLASPSYSNESADTLYEQIKKTHKKLEASLDRTNSSYDRKWEAWDKRGRKGKEPTIDQRNSLKLSSSLLSTTQKFLDKFPKDPRKDEVTLTKGKALLASGKKLELKELEDVATKSSKEDLAAEAGYIVGDYYFDRNDFKSAKKFYRRSTLLDAEPHATMARFKLAWCHYNLGDYKEAARHWAAVIRIGKKSKSEVLTKLYKESLRDITYAMTELPTSPRRAIKFFKKYSPDDDASIKGYLTMLGNNYADTGDYNKAIRTYTTYIKMFPKAQEIPEAYKQLLTLHYELGQSEKLVNTLRDMDKHLAKDSEWAKRNDKSSLHNAHKTVTDQINYFKKLYEKRMLDNNDEKSKATLEQLKAL